MTDYKTKFDEKFDKLPTSQQLFLKVWFFAQVFSLLALGVFLWARDGFGWPPAIFLHLAIFGPMAPIVAATEDSVHDKVSAIWNMFWWPVIVVKMLGHGLISLIFPEKNS